MKKLEKDGIKYKVIDIGKHDKYKFSEVTFPKEMGDNDSEVITDYIFRNCLSLKKITVLIPPNKIYSKIKEQEPQWKTQTTKPNNLIKPT